MPFRFGWTLVARSFTRTVFASQS